MSASPGLVELDKSNVWAVIVSFTPPAGFSERLAAIAGQCGAIVVVDNASEQPPCPSPGITVIRNSENLGIAKALNQGIENAAEHGAKFALLLDHDSCIGPKMLDELMATLQTASENAVACVPRIAYGHPSIRCRWPQTSPSNRFRFRFVYADTLSGPAPVDLAIGSGMLIHIERFKAIGGFDESLFIDLVDTEFCLRARQNGFVVIAQPKAVLTHQLGEVEERSILGFIKTYPTHHSAKRHWYLSRNRIILSRRYARRFPSWLAYEWLGAVKLLVKVVLFEPGRWSKIVSMLKGTWAGVRFGAGP